MAHAKTYGKSQALIAHWRREVPFLSSKETPSARAAVINFTEIKDLRVLS